MTDTLTLPIKSEYFDAIKSGEKVEEYRLRTDYWRKRLIGKSYEWIILTKGYPKRVDQDRRLAVRWNGYRETTLTHPHFGPDPVEVFAIDVSQ